MIRFAKIIGIVFLLLAMVLVGLQFLPEMADITEAVKVMQCQNQLESVFSHLVEYGKSHDRFPMTPDGDLDLRAVYDALQVPEPERTLCPNNNNFDCYVFRKGLKPSDLNPAWQSDVPWTIIAMDKKSNHPITEGFSRGKLKVNVLFSGGTFTSSMILTVDEYDILEQKLEHGEMFDNTILAD